ncbi:hypothetical protein BCR35DRAFT_306732 [Leucosporidium creatinivorum]|uniref:Non-structural maintenance of chromosomes element 1 homolog n=1 Tax=Leucosporidium creatinivorum TaxID=106004 RepID=A0A1Y2ERR4_9BASI|nr:hypothetical protein BCR35DRAFT_306732 [Leucosporidium creatinivorum]
MAASKNRRQVQESSDEDEGAGARLEAPVELRDPRKTLRHLFLQSLISRRCVKLTLAKKIYSKCLDLCGLDDSISFERFIAELEEPLSVIHLDIKTTRDQETGEAYVSLINTVSDSVAKLATDYTAVEIAHFRAIIESIMTAPQMAYSISMKDAVRCYKGEKRADGQRVIKSLLAKGWLSLHPSQHLTLSTRALAELNSYLRETFNAEDDDEDTDARHRAVVDCDSCLAMVTSGYACPNEDCAIRLHTFCAPHKLGAAGKCPDHLNGGDERCQQQWISVSGKFVGTPVGIDAIVGADFENTQDDDLEETSPARPTASKKKRASGGSKGASKGKKSRRSKDDDDEEEDELEDDDDEEDEAEESDVPTPKARTSSRRRSSTVNAFVDDEADGEDEEMYE